MAFDPSNSPHQLRLAGFEQDFHLLHASYSQKINRGFIIEVDAACDDPNIDLEDLIGKGASVHIGKLDGEGGLEHSLRILHGVVVEARLTGETTLGLDAKQEAHVYELAIGPFMDLGLRRRDSKVFQAMSPADIIEALANEHANGLGGVNRLGSAGDAPILDHIIQYNESDFHFVRRLAERYGINTLYRMSDGNHDMVLYDENAEAGKEITTYDVKDPNKADLQDITRRKTFRTAVVEMSDYDQFKPNADQTEYQEDMPTYGAAVHEEFGYPGGYHDGIDRAKIAKRRLDAIKSENEQLSANCRTLEIDVGQRIEIEGHASDLINGTYVVTSHSLSFGNAGHGHGGGTSCRVTLLPDDVELAPSRTVPQPQTPSIVTAKVVDGSENDPEALGRIKVHYPFVRQDDSFWCRVAQSWAGPGLGTWVNHRIDHEVLIAFEHGDINRPIVIGSLYNGKNSIPWAGDLGDEISGWRSQSSSGFNEIMFRDKDGDELFSTTAEKNMTVLVKDNQSSTIGSNHTREVGADSSVTVGGATEYITGKTTLVESADTITITSPKKIELICGGSSITLTPNQIEARTTMHSIIASANASVVAGAMASIKAGANVAITAVNNIANTAGRALKLQSAKTISQKAQEDFSIETDTKFSLTTKDDATYVTEGDMKVDVKKGIKIKGAKNVEVVSQKNAIIKGKKVNMN